MIKKLSDFLAKSYTKKFDANYKMMIPPFRISDFSKLTPGEAKKHFEWFTGEVPKRIEYLKELLSNDGIEDILDYTPESLIPLWDWYEGKIKIEKISKEKYEKELSETPEWVHPYIKDEDLSIDTLKYCMDVSIYFAEVMIRNNANKIIWGFFTKPKNHVSVNRPTLLGFKGRMNLDPYLILTNTSRKSSREKCKTRLYDIYNVWLQYIE